MRRSVTATSAAMLLGCATVATLLAPLAAAEDAASRTEPATAPVSGSNSPPVAVDDAAQVSSDGSVVVPVLDNDTDPDGDLLTLVGVVDAPANGGATPAGEGVEYVPHPGYSGADSFTYEVSDGELSAIATVSLTVTSSANTSPVAVDDVVTTSWGLPVTIDVRLNDSDPDGDPLAVAQVATPEHGLVEVVDGLVRYSPRGEFVGTELLPYQVIDGRGGVADAQLAVRVEAAYRVDVRRVPTQVALRPSTVVGVVSTRLDGPVRVTLERRNDAGRWRALRTVTVVDRDRFSISWTPPQPGRTSLRFRSAWATGQTAVSAAIRTRIEARFDPVVEPVRRDDVPHTWRPGCPVGPAGLRQIRMSYWDYQGRLRRGTLIGASWVVGDYLAVFRRAFDTKFAIKKMYPADRYGGVDERAMRAGNTSAFNCRHVTGNPYRMSQHSYGNAIDINTFENPYVTGSRVYPPKAAVPYYHRREYNLRDPGVITRRSSIARELWHQGWAWGARWSLPDYQHWSSNGG